MLGVLGGNSLILQAVEEEGRTAHAQDVRAVVERLLGDQLPQVPRELLCQRLNTHEGTDQHQGPGLGLLEKLEGDPGTYGPAHDDDVLLLEAHFGGGKRVDKMSVLDDGLRAGFALVDAVAGVLHGEDVDLRGGKGTW